MKTYCVKEIAEILKTNPETVRRWIRSGKLGAIQESRKGGNVVTEEMLSDFLKSSPKYAGAAAGLLASPVWITAATATLVGGIFAKRIINSNKDNHTQIDIEEIRKILLSNIQSAESSIKRKKESIRQLQDEIEEEQRHIDEALNLIAELDVQSNKKQKGDQSNE